MATGISQIKNPTLALPIVQYGVSKPNADGTQTLAAPGYNNAQPTPTAAPTTESLVDMQARVGNQGKPGYDVFGNPIDGTVKASAITGNGKYGGISAEDAAFNALNIQSVSPTLTPEQESNIRSQQLQMHQAEIDAANRYYDDLVSKTMMEGQGYLGSQGARQARAGLLGSDFGAAQEAKTIAFNDSQVKSVNSERNNKIASIYAQGRSDATAEIRAQREAAKQGYDTYIAYLNGKQERQAARTTNAAAALLASGVDLTDPNNQSVLDEAAKAYQIDSAALLAEFKNSKLAQDNAATKNKLANQLTQAQILDMQTKNEYQTLADGAQLYDREGNLIAENMKNFKAAQAAAGAAARADKLLSVSEAQALGVPYGTTASQAFGVQPTKPLTEAQGKDLTYGARANDADAVISRLEGNVVKYNPATYMASSAAENTTIGNTFVSDEVKQLRQAHRNFITAILRRESGATINPSEFSVAEKQYFPQPGDDAATLAQKKRARTTAINAFNASAGAQNVARFNEVQNGTAGTTGTSNNRLGL